MTTPTKLPHMRRICGVLIKVPLIAFPKITDQKGAVLNKIIVTPSGNLDIVKMFKK
jgi:hypothetical protein